MKVTIIVEVPKEEMQCSSTQLSKTGIVLNVQEILERGLFLNSKGETVFLQGGSAHLFINTIEPLTGVSPPTEETRAEAVISDVLETFEKRERGLPQAHIASRLVEELREALLKSQTDSRARGLAPHAFKAGPAYISCTVENPSAAGECLTCGLLWTDPAHQVHRWPVVQVRDV